jgi:hypothetical protein
VDNDAKIIAFDCTINPGRDHQVDVVRPSGKTPLPLHSHLAAHAEQFGWGLNTGSTTQLALAICAELFGPSLAVRAAQAVKHRFLVFADYNADLMLDAAEIVSFVEERFTENPA